METILRVGFVYLFLMVALRVMGKREFGELAPFDLVVLLLIPELFAQALLREDFSMTNAIIATSTLLTCVFLTSVLSYRFPKIGTLVAGKPAVLAADGAFVPDNLDRERVAPEEVMEALHASGLEELGQVKWVILEADGRLAVVPVKQPPIVHREEGKHTL